MRSVLVPSPRRGSDGLAVCGRFFILLSVVLFAIGSPHARAAIAPPLPEICNSIDLPPPELRPPGGMWWNPKRYGVGWQTVYKDEGGARKLQLYWYTFKSNGRPIWYFSDFEPFTGPTWTAKLWKRTETGTADQQIGEVALSTVTNHPERVALAWSRTDGGVNVARVEECVLDLLRTEPLNAVGTHDRAVNSTYGGVWEETSNPNKRTLNVAMNNAPSGQYIELLLPLLYDNGGEPVWLYGENPGTSPTNPPLDPNGAYTHGINYVYANFQPQDECTTLGDPRLCTTHVNTTHTVKRTFNDPSSGTAVINICSADGGTCSITLPGTAGTHTIRGWRRPASGSVAVNIHKPNPYNAIEVNQYECEAPSGGTTCPIRVSWALVPGQAVPVSVWRKSTVSGCTGSGCMVSLREPSLSDQLTDNLPVWQRVRYELRAGTTSSGTLLDYTPEVKSYGEMPDADPANLGTPNHDPTVGALAGTPGVSGGAATYTVPIEVPPGRRGMAPELALTYSSRAGNGIAGMGWSLSGLSSIHRCPKTVAQDEQAAAVDFSANDRLCLDGRRLVLTNGGTYGTSGREYRTEIDDFARVTQLGTGGLGATGGGEAPSNTMHFKVEHTSGLIDWYGGYDNSTADTGRHTPAGAAGVLTWALVRREDRHGNYIRYTYTNYGNGEYLISSIRYTGKIGSGDGNRRVDFLYSVRPTTGGANDYGSSYLLNGLTMQTRRLDKISLFSPLSTTAAYREYRLGYGNPSSYSWRSLLRTVQDCAIEGGQTYCKPVTQMGWQESTPTFQFKPITIAGLPFPEPVPPPPYWGGGIDPPPPPPTGRGGELPANLYADELMHELQREQLHPEFRDAFDAGEMPPVPLEGVSGQMMELRPMADFNGDGSLEWFARVRVDADQNRFFIVRMNADRQVLGVHEVTALLADFYFGTSSTSQPADVNNDGKAELIGRSGNVFAFGFWNDASSSFSTVATNIPYYFDPSGAGAPNYSTDIYVADFDGDGKADVLTAQPRTMVSGHSCASNEKPLMLYRNTTADTATQTPQFSTTPQLVRCLQWITVTGQANRESTERIGDFDGNGLPDVFILNPYGTTAIPHGKALSHIVFTRRSAGGTLSFDPQAVSGLGPSLDDGDLGRVPTSLVFWTDVNGDGLEDLVVGRGTWTIRLNQGGRFGPRINTGNNRGLFLDLNPSDPLQSTQRFASLIRVGDYDADGRSDLLIPNGFAMRMCTWRGPVQNPTDPSCSGSDGLPGKPNPCLGYFMCPEDPVTGSGFASIHGVITGEFVANAHQNGFGAFDQSLYTLGVLRFVQTGPATFTLSETASNHIGGAGGDLYGDGLQDFVGRVGCGISQTGTSSWCRALSSPWGPQQLPNGTLVTHYEQFNNGHLYASENLGVGSRGTNLPPLAPELLFRVTDGMNREATWEYFPLSSKAGRGSSSSTRPFYSIPERTSGTGYIDARHFYFTSTMNAVEAFSVSNGNGSYKINEYSYEEAVYNNQGRGFQGFRKITEDRLHGTTAPLRVETLFHQNAPLTGLVESTHTRLMIESAGLPPIERTANSYALLPLTQYAGEPTRYHPYLKQSVRELHDLGTRALHTRVTSIVDTVDAYGNVQQQRTITDDGAQACTMPPSCPTPQIARRTETVTNTFELADASTWWVNRLKTTQTTQSISWYIDPVPTTDLTLTTEFGNYTAQRQPGFAKSTASGDGAVRQVDYTYDQWGNVSQEALHGSHIASADARIQATTYESSGYFPHVLSNALSHQTTLTYDPRFGVVTAQTDPNGLTTATTPDPFGRAKQVTAPGLPPRHTGLQRCSSTHPCITGAVYRQETRQDGTPITIVYFDHLGRELGTDTRGLASQGTTVRTLKQYHANGLLHRESVPHFSTQTPIWMTYGTYDALGRLTQKTTPVPAGGTRTTLYGYSGLVTSIRACAGLSDGSGNCIGGATATLGMSRTYNTAGQLLETVDAKNGEVSYRYDGGGNVVMLVDPISAITTAVYNGLGQRIQMTDPDRGTWIFQYNAANEVVAQWDNRKHGEQRYGLHWVRDRLGRPLTEYEHRPPQQTGWTELYKWTYDPANGKGRLAETRRVDPRYLSTEPPYLQTFTYDALSRPTSEIVWIRELRNPETAYHSSTNPYVVNKRWLRRVAYDAHHGWLKQEYRGVAEVNVGESAMGSYSQYWRRDSYGYLTEEGGLRDWGTGLFGRKITEMSPWGSATKETLGNGHLTTSSYLPATGQLDDRCVGAGCAVVDLTYGYDSWGNLTSQASGALSETFSYDELHRLTRSVRSAPANTTVTYEYDPSGNLIAKSDYSQGSPGSYQYTSGRPHAVSGVTPPTGLALQFDYDGNGNQVARRQGTTVNRGIGYDIHNRPERLRNRALDNPTASAGDTVFRYAPSGERYLQRVRNSLGYDDITQYPFAGYELVGNTNTTSTGFHYSQARQYLGGWGVRVSKYGPDLPTLYWQHTDRLGSSVAKTGQTGAMVTNAHGHHERHGYDPFGKPRLGDWQDQWGNNTGSNAAAPGAAGVMNSVVTPRGFTGHEHLEGQHAYKLIHMNGRMYDPLLGRFLGVDPIIQFPENSQSLNPYSYILNNPLAGTDPTGYAVCEAGKKFDCTFVKTTHEAPTGSRIKSNTVISGNVADNSGKSASFSFTLDKNGQMVSGGIVSNGSRNGQAAENRKDQGAVASSKGASSLRSNAVTAGIAGTAGTLEETAGSRGIGQLIRGMFSARGLTGAGAAAWPSATAEGNDRPNEEIALAQTFDKAWGDALTVATALARAGNRSVVIGESMSRVIPAADAWHAQTINFGDYWKSNPTPADLMTGIVFNAGWMVGVMANHMQIYDIGMDMRRLERSPNYRIERQMIDLSRYPRYEQRSWDQYGAWDYLNAK